MVWQFCSSSRHGTFDKLKRRWKISGLNLKTHTFNIPANHCMSSSFPLDFLQWSVVIFDYSLTLTLNVGPIFGQGSGNTGQKKKKIRNFCVMFFYFLLFKEPKLTVPFMCLPCCHTVGTLEIMFSVKQFETWYYT